MGHVPAFRASSAAPNAGAFSQISGVFRRLQPFFDGSPGVGFITAQRRKKVWKKCGG
jgi:hypothetical protein